MLSNLVLNTSPHYRSIHLQYTLREDDLLEQVRSLYVNYSDVTVDVFGHVVFVISMLSSALVRVLSTVRQICVGWDNKIKSPGLAEALTL